MLRAFTKSFSVGRTVSAPVMSRAMAYEGSIKDEGGKLAKKAAADENQYIRQIEKEQWKALKQHHTDEIEEHKQDIKRLQQRIKEHEDRLKKITHHEDN